MARRRTTRTRPRRKPKRSGGELRGNSEDRRRSKKKLLKKFGNGRSAPCHRCRRPVGMKTMVRDRRRPGKKGGRYKFTNLRVSCKPCSNKSGGRIRKGK